MAQDWDFDFLGNYAIVNATNVEQSFLEACRDGNFQGIMESLRNGMNINFQNNGGDTALHRASRGEDGRLVLFLLENNASPLLTNEQHQTALHLVAKNGNVEIARALLDAGSEINAQELMYGDSPLHIACSHGHSELVSLLLNRGAEVDKRNNYGDTPLHRACFSGHSSIVLELLARGANDKLRTNEGDTPLHRAVYFGAHEVLSILLHRGADPTIQNQYGNSPIDISKSMKNFDSVTLFEQAMYFRRQRLSWLAFRSELLTTFETDSVSSTSVIKVLTVTDLVRNRPQGEIKRIAPQRRRNQIPDEILKNDSLNQAISLLPANYNFEIHKTIWRIQTEDAKMVALQFPEGLLMYACVISDIIERFGNAKVIIMADVTYGACCIDDFTAKKIGADLLIHYGHSCLVPLNITTIKVLYVFVEIQFDITHLVACIKDNFLLPSSPQLARKKLAIMGTIQFASAINTVISQLQKECPEESNEIVCPQAKPLSSGETLGCTSPILTNCEAVVFVADGRFHLESVMIQNPSLHDSFYRYDPYNKILSHEGYDTEKMRGIRWEAISQSRRSLTFGIVLGTLGRQGNQHIFNRMRRLLKEWDERERHWSGKNRKAVLFLMAELNPLKIASIRGIDSWVQISCPRLSIDWGSEFKQPTLTSYEFEVLVGTAEWGPIYPMDYYRKDAGTWNNFYSDT